MSKMTRLALPVAATALALGLAACGGSGDPAVSLSDPKSGAIDNVKNSVVRIEAEGTFSNPGSTAASTVAGSGSGFVIDTTGLAVTNNHVVAGSALLRVYVGDDNEPHNARVVGRSECSDLAVVKIDGDEGDFSALEWEPEPVEVGTEVYAAGFPLGDEEFSLTRGIVSKRQTDGETPWASVDSTLEHDATINPGSSGGPLLTERGTVVGVNYASRPEASQYFAISEQEAQPILGQLEEGDDVTAVGINARAVLSSESGRSGVWVSSIESGSPADKAGLKPGDIILQLENLPVGREGSLSDYCDIIRSRQASDPLAVQVLRPSANAVFEGWLNGEKLKQTFSFSQQAGSSVREDDGSATYPKFRRVSDNTGGITVRIPAEWRDVNGRSLPFGPQILASRNLARAEQSKESGIGIIATKRAGSSAVGEVLGAIDAEVRNDCGGSSSAKQYARGRFQGQYRIYTQCDGQKDSAAIVVSATPRSGNYLVVIVLQATSRRDLDALDGVLDSIGVRPSRF